MEKRANQESEIGVHKYEGFTMMQNHHLRNKGLSLKAVGLLSKILSLPPNWDYSLRGLATLNTDGIDGVRSAMKELEGFYFPEELRPAIKELGTYVRDVAMEDILRLTEELCEKLCEKGTDEGIL